MDRTAVVDAIADRIVALRLTHPTRVAVDGIDAAGKTTLADELHAAVVARGRVGIRASVDGFHNAAAVRYRLGKDSPEGYFVDSFNYAALLEFLLLPLGPGGARSYRRAVFDFRTDEPAEVVIEHAPDDALLIFDGVFLLRDELRDHWDFSIFVDVSFDAAMARARTRDVPLLGSPEAVEERYARRYFPGQLLYFEACHPKQVASVVIENDDLNRPNARPGAEPAPGAPA